MWRFVSIMGIAVGLTMPAPVIAGEARAVMQVGITITGKDSRSAAPKAGAGQRLAPEPATKPASAK